MRRSLLVAGLALATVAGTTLVGSGLAAATGGPSCAKQTRDGKLSVIGLTADQKLVCFKENRPANLRTIGTVTGLVTDTTLVGIDVRPATGALYGLGNAGGVYIVSASDATAALQSRLNVALNGTSFGVDFNPTVDRLRVVSDTGQNLRANVVDGVTTTDLALNYVAGTPATGVVAAAYTNNDADPNTATTLFDVDASLDQLAIQAPPNNGSLNPTGKLGADVSSPAGADIYSRVRNGTTVQNTAFAALGVGGRSAFFGVDVLTGRVALKGWFPAASPITAIAVPTI